MRLRDKVVRHVPSAHYAGDDITMLREAAIFVVPAVRSDVMRKKDVRTARVNRAPSGRSLTGLL
jgi:hypothetical protein